MDSKYLCVFDLDGTLLNSFSQISKENLDAIKGLRKTGTKLMIATGRNKLMAQIYLQELGSDIPLISSNGSLVTVDGEKDPLFISSFQDDTLEKIIHRCHRRGLDHLCYTYRHIFVSSGFTAYDLSYMEDHAQNDPYTDIVELSRNEEEAMEMLKNDSSGGVLKVLVVYPDSEDIEYFMKLRQASSAMSQAIAIDIMPEGANKGSALKKTAEKLGIERKNIFAFGDYYNDMDMLMYAGHSVAMGNAPKDIRDSCEYVTLSNDDSGVAHAIREMIMPIISG